MSKKDYVLIAGAIWKCSAIVKDNNIQTTNASEMIRAIAGQLAIDLKQDNPRFDQHKFYEACGLEIE